MNQHATPLAWDLALASRMRETGMTYAQIGAVFKLSPDTIHSRTDPAYRAKRQWQKSAKRNELLAGARAATNADIAARLAEIPRDTRGLTAFVFGDPIPGRFHFGKAVGVKKISLARVSILGDKP
ncbi:hypothetical protein ACHMW7_08975 [Aminobacter sp. UC22_36]|uniref:hypothetical protein n=1 Tax=Aminobacter sp. UC22_36 TaxID=3374549 RepID=UPI00375708B9